MQTYDKVRRSVLRLGLLVLLPQPPSLKRKIGKARWTLTIKALIK